MYLNINHSSGETACRAPSETEIKYTYNYKSSETSAGCVAAL